MTKTAPFFAILLLISSGSLRAQAAKSFPSGIGHVVVIGLDGGSPDGIRTANTPVIHSLIKDGAVKWNVRTVLPSISAPNWASMIMGAGIEAHGTTDNDWGRAEYTLPPIVSDEDGSFPSIFYWVRKNRPKAEIGTVYQWGGFGNLFEKSAVNYDKNMPDEDATTEAFSKYLVDKKPLFAFLHLDYLDDVGHGQGHGTPAYYKAWEKTDSLIGQVVETIRKAGMEKNTLLIITADHGGIGFGHGGATVEEAEIAMIFHGAGVKNGYVVQQQVYTYDLAATIAFALHIVPPYAWTGRPVKSAFTGFSEPANLYMGRSVIPNPKVFPWRYLYQQAGGLYVDSSATVSMQTMADSAKTYYTTDGSMPTAASREYLKPFVLDSSTVVTAKSFDKKGNSSQPVSAYYRLVKSNEGHGVHVRYFNGKDWNHMPAFDLMNPAQEWDSYEIVLDRAKISAFPQNPDGVFGCVLTGYVQIDQPGKYTFYTRSDDGSKLYIDGKEIVNNDGDHGVIEKNGDVDLATGKHVITVEYFNGNGGYWLEPYYKGPGVPKQIIPAGKLYLRQNE